MSSLASVWSDLKDTFFPTVAFADDGDDEPADDAAASSDDKDEDAEPADEGAADAESEDNEAEAKDAEAKDAESSDGDAEEEGGDEDGDGDGDEDEDEDEDDEDDEDELVDPLDALREKYTASVCHSFKHHFDECVERVTAAQEEPDYEDRHYKEDCVEEYFHLQHCLNDQIAPVLFSKLK